MKSDKGNSDLMIEDVKAPDKGYAIIRFPERSTSAEPLRPFVGVHGDDINFSASIKRGEYVPVPWPAVLALREAKEPMIETKEINYGPVKLQETIKKTVPRKGMTFEIIRRIGKQEYDTLRGIAQQRSLTEAEAFGG